MRSRLLMGLTLAWALAPAVLAQAPAPGGPPASGGGPSHGGPPKLDPRMPDLFLAAGRDDAGGIRKILTGGLDPDVRNILEMTPLMYSVAVNRRAAAEALLAGGAKVDAPSPFGTALTLAEAEGNAPLALLLLDHGASPNPKRNDGIQPLMLAAWNGHQEVMRRLIERGATVDARNNDGATALSYAARGGSAEAAGMLLERGAMVDAADSRGWTPLMYAAVNGRAAVAKALLAKGARAAAREAGGRTPLLLAAAYGGGAEVARVLLEGGADPAARDGRGRTALTLAATREYGDLVELLRARGAAAEPAPVVPQRSVRESAEAGLKLLQASQGTFLKKLGCSSCHHQSLALLTTGTAAERGFAVDAALRKSQVERSREAIDGFKPFLIQAVAHPDLAKQVPFAEIQEASVGDSFTLGGLAAVKAPPSPGLNACATVLARRQEADGHWAHLVPRVPVQSSQFTTTALAIRSLKAYAPATSAADTTARIRRALHWLLTTPAVSSEDRAFRLLGLAWAGATPAERKASVEAIRADQRADGGWGQLDSLKSDAYATGEALYALATAGGVPVADPALQRGLSFLRRTQDDDGSWFINKRAAPLNFYTDAGFPHGESQYVSFAGTCWATMALMVAAEPAPRGQR